MSRVDFVWAAAALLMTGAAGAVGPQRQPKLAAPVQVLDGAEPINASNGDAAPAVVDFDRDGKKDLLVGQFDGGKCRIYLNQGTDARPRFKGFRYVAVGGKDITVPFG